MSYIFRVILLVTFINIFSNSILIAQKDNEIKNNKDMDLTITFVLQAQSVVTEHNPPLILVEKIVKESSLAKINVESSSDKRLNIEAFFVFKNMDSFIKWNEGKELKEIFNELERIGIRSVIRNISVKKHPNASLFK